jgi:hypothetical protein
MASLTSSVRQACGMPAGFPEIPDPAAVLLPERFRGPVAPSAADAPPGPGPKADSALSRAGWLGLAQDAGIPVQGQ